MQHIPLNSSWCEIYPAQIDKNLLHALGLLPKGTSFCAVLKADAYGHGIENVVPILLHHGITHVGITSNGEARAVRQAGFAGTLMRLRTATLQEIENARDDDVQEQVSTLKAARAIHDLQAQLGQPIKLHLSLNAGGMSRDGLELASQSAKDDCLEILRLCRDQIVGICTHFPTNEPDELEDSISRFHQDLDWVFANSDLNRDDILIHGGSTLTLLSGFDTKTDMMRCGAIMYGVALPDRDFCPTISLKARVTNITTYPQGSTIGYDRAQRLERDSLLANVSIGYSNGYGREFSGKGFVLIQGHKVPLLGKISMNTVVADITGLEDVSEGDEAVLFGPQGHEAITGDMIQEQSGTILADLYTDWGQRNPRLVCE
ncbi:alanine racemase [Terasakiella pusilla]|uniref:alanine racemase n=1 Tax=Terasakiella pusilla TaxID=64973 RepID=UPI003AA9BEFE